MEELDYDSGRFAFSLPVWFVRMSGEPKAGLAGNKFNNGGAYVVAFTDMDLVERYIAKRAMQGQPGMVAAQVTDNEHLVDVLKGLRSDGITHVAFDGRFPVNISRLLERNDDDENGWKFKNLFT